MITVGIFEAKGNLGQLAQAAADGEVVVLTRRGRVIAEIRPPGSETAEATTRKVIASLRALRRAATTEPFDVAELIAEGRR